MSAGGSESGGWKAWRIGRSGPAEFAALSVMGLFLAAFSAFESERNAFWVSLLYWQAAMLGGGVIASLIEPPLHRLMTGRPRLFAVSQAIAMTPPIAVWIWVLSNLFEDRGWRLDLFALLIVPVFNVNVAVVILAWLLRGALAPRHRPASPDAPPPELRAKLPPRLARARLIAVEAEDHYLRIHTDAGSDLIHMSLSSALAALKDRDGLQVHRSWWVARRAVEAARWRKGRGVLTLTGGIEAPVSESRAAAVRALDWA